MTVSIYDDKRLQLLDMLPADWTDIIKQYYLAKDVPPMSVWPDEVEVYAGNDAEALAVLEKHGLATDEIRKLLSDSQ